MAPAEGLRVRYADEEEEEWPISAVEAARWLQRGGVSGADGQASSFVFRGLKAQPVWDISSSGRALSELCRALESSYSELRQEAVALLHGSLLGDGSDSDGSDAVGDPPPLWRSARGEGLVASGAWQKIPLWTGGVRHDAACARLPRAASIIAAFGGDPVMMHPPGRVFLSLMLPGTHIAPHAGPTNHRLRLHLPLLLPLAADPAAGTVDAAPELGVRCGPAGSDTAREGQPFMVVAGRRLEWQEGRCLLFDDSFTHEVHYPTAPSRPPSEALLSRPPVSSTAAPPVAPRAPSVAAHDSANCERTACERPAPACDVAWASALCSIRLLLVLDVWHPEAAQGPFPLCNKRRAKRRSATPQPCAVERRRRVASDNKVAGGRHS